MFEISEQITKNARVPIYSWIPYWEIEEGAQAQLRDAVTHPNVTGHIAVFPDIHQGWGLPIGTAFVTTNVVVPNAVGVDIGCVDGETEYLSPDGWKRIDQYQGGQVLQYDAYTGLASFVVPSHYINKPVDTFIQFKTKYGVNQMLTPEHRVLVWWWTGGGRNRRQELRVLSAEQLADLQNSYALGAPCEFETAFTLADQTEHLFLTDNEIRVQVAVIADGYLENNATCVVSVKKKRKFDRLITLLQKADIECSWKYNAKKKVFNVRFTPPMHSKSFSPFWVSSSEQLRIVAEECLYWDGMASEKKFYTCDKESADFIHYAFAASGYRSVLRCDTRNDGKTRSPEYTVFAHSKSRVGMQGGTSRAEYVYVPDGRAYCFTVPSSFWVMRRGGNIAITGNCSVLAVGTQMTYDPDPLFWRAWADNVRSKVPVGFGQHKEKQKWQGFGTGLQAPIDKKVQERAAYQLGSLGGGNHFLEAAYDESGRVWLMVHSGSRGIGNKIAQYYVDQAITLRRLTDAQETEGLASLPLDKSIGQNYLLDHDWATRYAAESRSRMMHTMLDVLETGAFPFVDSPHNQAWVKGDHVLHRKGATFAGYGEIGVIPGTMGTSSYIIQGLGELQAHDSCSHGAGRRMSRGKAKEAFDETIIAEQLKNTFTSPSIGLADEAPGAYKLIEDVIAKQEGSLFEVVQHLTPIITIKGDAKARDD